MSDEFEVHGPHDHAVEHVGAGHSAHADADPFASRMAVMTAILATIGAIYAYQSGTSENLALYYKNEAAIKKTEAANQWSYYQAKGEKENLAELGAALSAPGSDAHAKFAADVDKYKQQKDPIRAKAEAIEKEVADNDAQSEKLLHGHHLAHPQEVAAQPVARYCRSGHPVRHSGVPVGLSGCGCGCGCGAADRRAGSPATATLTRKRKSTCAGRKHARNSSVPPR
jgi:hypothetical protein